MSCTYRDRTETLLAYVRQELNPEAQEAFETHYFACAECAEEVLFYEKTTMTMQSHGGIVFARPKQHRLESITALQHLINRWSKRLGLVLGEGGAARVLAGYALLIVFLSASSFWLFKAAGSSSKENTHEVVSAVAPPLIPAHPTSPLSFHLDWPHNLKLTDDPLLQTQLNTIQPIYQTQKDYKAASEALTNFLKTAPQAHEEGVKLYLAVCWMNQNLKSEASELLQAIEQNASSLYRSQAQLVLLQLKKE